MPAQSNVKGLGMLNMRPAIGPGGRRAWADRGPSREFRHHYARARIERARPYRSTPREFPQRYARARE